jgi:hypothetical protein
VLLPRIIIIWFFSQQDRGLAVQEPPDSGDGIVIYCSFTLLWNSFLFVVLKYLHRFKVGILRKGFCHERSTDAVLVPVSAEVQIK